MIYFVVPFNEIFLEKVKLDNFLRFSDRIKASWSAVRGAFSLSTDGHWKEVLEDLEVTWVTSTHSLMAGVP